MRAHAKYCGKACYRNHANANFRPGEPKITTPATTGAISELVAASDLMRKGYHVFRAMSPSCPCDLIAFDKNGIKKVEVRTGRLLASNKLFCAFSLDVIEKADTLAIVIDNEVKYCTPEEYRKTIKRGSCSKL